jgi:hypothetical protein
MLQVALALALLFAAEPENPNQGDETEVWAGHEVLKGKRKIPIYGEQQTHTDNYVVAEVRRSEWKIDIRQKLCRVDVQPIKGVTAKLSAETVARLPRSHVQFVEKPDGALAASPWRNGWSSEDVDGDGHPGATVQIIGTCSGSIYVSNQSESSLISGRTTQDGAVGELSVKVQQKVLGASGLCLKLVAGDSDETQTGWFAYRRVQAGSSCKTLADRPWPVKAGPSAGASPAK